MPSRWRVRIGFVVAGLALWLACPTPVSLAAGGALAWAGEAIRLWASGHIEKTRALATGGPYAHTQNPLYLGSLLIAAGMALASASLWAALLVAGYALAFYPSLLREEASFLRRKFGDAYEAWVAAVPVLLPRPRPSGPRETRFAWPRVSSNREWRAIVGLAAALVALWARGRFRG